MTTPAPLRSRDRYRLALTPAGAGVLSLFFPGLLIAGVTRQRLLVAISVGAGLILVLNAVIARLALRRITVTLDAPDRATVGDRASVLVALSGPRSLACHLGLERAMRSWVAAVVPYRGPIAVELTERGVVTSLAVRIQTTVPFGLAAFVRVHQVGLRHDLLVAPPAIPVTVPPDPTSLVGAARSAGDPAGLRPYADGDRRRDVHWPTVARTGNLMVVERSGDRSSVEVTVVVDGPAAGDVAPVDADLLLGRARAAIECLVARGCRVDLVTREQEEPTTGPVDDRRALLARLARATTGPAPPVAASGRPQLVVSTEGLRWVPPS